MNRYKNSSISQKQNLDESTKKWREANPDLLKAIRNRSDSKRKESRKDKYLKSTFNLTYLEFLEMLKNQNYVCAICKKEETLKDRAGDTRQLSVDHCHTTGKVRGLLCSCCNLAIGNLKEDESLFYSAISYLREHNDEK